MSILYLPVIWLTYWIVQMTAQSVLSVEQGASAQRFRRSPPLRVPCCRIVPQTPPPHPQTHTRTHVTLHIGPSANKHSLEDVTRQRLCMYRFFCRFCLHSLLNTSLFFSAVLSWSWNFINHRWVNSFLNTQVPLCDSHFLYLKLKVISSPFQEIL